MDELLESLLLSSSSSWPEMSSVQVPGSSNSILVENDIGSGGSSSSELSALSAFGFAADSFVSSSSPLLSPLGHVRVDNFPGESGDGEGGLSLGKRSHFDEEMVAREKMFVGHYDDMQGNLLLQVGIAGTQSQQQNLRTQNSVQQYGGHSAVSQDQSGVVKPRVRARRGQATDPHSIAERVRICSYFKHCNSYLMSSKGEDIRKNEVLARTCS